MVRLNMSCLGKKMETQRKVPDFPCSWKKRNSPRENEATFLCLFTLFNVGVIMYEV